MTDRARVVLPVLLLAGAGCASIGAAPLDREEAMTREQIRIAEIPAPTGHERARGAYVAAELRKAGLSDVRVDEVGNVLAWRRGAGKRVLAIAAHLDTVHPPGTPIRIERRGSVLRGPGACDDAAGLVALLEIARRWDTPHQADLLFVATVGEEGRGDLRGARHLVRTQRIDLLVAIDGWNPGTIVNAGVGSRRWKIGYVSERGGGHSWSDFGRANPAHALGRLVEKLARHDVPREPKTTFNVGVVSGADEAQPMGSSINTIPPAALAQIDLRSEDRGALERLEAHLLRAAEEAREEENAWSRARGPDVPVRLHKELVGDRPVGRTPPEHPIVQVFREEMERAGLPVRLGASSTDANAAMAAGIAAVAVPSGGRARNVHSPDETHDVSGRLREVEVLRAALARLAR